MSNWKEYFEVVKIKPGRVVTPAHGELDFGSDKIPVETCQELYETDFPYLKITKKGREVLYGQPEKPAVKQPAAAQVTKGKRNRSKKAFPSA